MYLVFHTQTLGPTPKRRMNLFKRQLKKAK